MSKSIDGLAVIVADQLAKDPRSDGVFVFVNAKRDRVKLLWKDRTGWCLLYKRLDARLVVRPLDSSSLTSPAVSMDGRTLAMLLDGVAQVRRERAKETAKRARTRALSVIESMSISGA
jgi:transposase